jgi:hypothetical protein
VGQKTHYTQHVVDQSKEHSSSGWPPIDVVLSVLVIAAMVARLILWFRNIKRFGIFGWLGKQLTADGYVRKTAPSGRHQYEHREIAQKILGRRLQRGEVVHHINGHRSDNRPENLCVMGYRDHIRYHDWYDWIYKTYGKYPRRETQLRKLKENFQGILLADHMNRTNGTG